MTDGRTADCPPIAESDVPVFGRKAEQVQEFLALLRPADVLIFDLLTLPGGLVQWGDQAPANHAALVGTGECAWEANIRVPESAPVIMRVPFTDYLDDVRCRTITAFRHVNLLRPAPERVASVLRRAQHYAGIGGAYAYTEALPLGLLAVDRSYGEYLTKLLDWRYRRTMNMVARVVRRRIPQNTATLFCSEFVYRCFLEAGADLAITILQPLLRNKDVVDKKVLVDRTSVVKAGTPWAVRSLWTEILTESESGDLKESRGPDPEDPLADAISPGDLYRSPSLVPIAALHTPPGRPFVLPVQQFRPPVRRSWLARLRARLGLG